MNQILIIMLKVCFVEIWSGMYILPKIWYFSPFPFSKMIFLPPSTVKISLFSSFFHLFPLIFVFLLDKSSYFFPPGGPGGGGKKKNIHPWICLSLILEKKEGLISFLNNDLYFSLLYPSLDQRHYVEFIFLIWSRENLSA